ncbi:unnamed protein product [Schistosoma turkestanicum]|nr:unnamed protein product [Schistosoma turkestanicum]
MHFYRIAERVTILGKDWHPRCLKCEHCKKTLTVGSHCEIGSESLRYCSDGSTRHSTLPNFVPLDILSLLSI